MRRQAPPRSKEKAIRIYGEDDVQECPQCGTWYTLHAAVPCLACSVGMEPYKE